MSDIMTNIRLPGLPGGYGRGEWGRKTRGEMIAIIRAIAASNLEAAQKILAAKDDDFVVNVVRGSIVQHLVEELKP